MRIMVTGREGQVARCLADCGVNHPDFNLIFAARSGTDVTLDLAVPDTIRAAVRTIMPDIIISAGAYTAVDQAEDEPDLVFSINEIAPGILAEEAEAIGAHIIHISTDYVFDGTLDRAYVETDAVNPIGVYGKSKLAGEEAVRNACVNHLILRTAWVYSHYGNNFYTTMLRLAETRDEVSVVDDQIGTPTAAADIAASLLSICQHWRVSPDLGIGEIFHFAGKDEMTWCDFARQIFAESCNKNGAFAVVKPITTEEFLMKAERPGNSRLNSSKFHLTFKPLKYVIA